MKRTVCFLILFTMMLHCASRLGIVTYLYNERHDIAHALGLIAEVPIALCDSAYFTIHAPLLIEDHDPEREAPAHLAQAHEIQLFFNNLSHPTFTLSSVAVIGHNTAMTETQYAPPIPKIFHPPCEA